MSDSLLLGGYAILVGFTFVSLAAWFLMARDVEELRDELGSLRLEKARDLQAFGTIVDRMRAASLRDRGAYLPETPLSYRLSEIERGGDHLGN